MKNMKKKGFTVVELVIVIAIVAILAAVLIPTFASLIKKANDSAYLQDRTNQQIADLVEKVEDQEFLTWEEFEAELAKQIATIDVADMATETDVEKAIADTKEAIANAVVQFELALKNNNTSLTEDQVKTIIEKALSNSLTTAQVQGIVDSAIANIKIPTGLTAKEVQDIVDAAVNKIPTASTKDVKAIVGEAIDEVLDAVSAVKTEINGKLNNVDDDDVTATINEAIEKALADINFNPEIKVETLTADQVKSIVDASLKNLEIVTAADVSKVVNTAVDGAVATLKNNIGDTGITKEEMQDAIEDALERVNVEVIAPGFIGSAGVDYGTIQSIVNSAVNSAVTNALNAFDLPTETDIKNLIDSAMGSAKLKADELAVKELNDVLAIAPAGTTIAEIQEILSNAGFNLKNGINALRAGNDIYWFKDANKIVLVQNNAVVYPADAALVNSFAAAAASSKYNLSELVNGSSVVVNGEVIGSLQDALNKGGEITLFNDLVAENLLLLKKDTVIDLNGHSIDFSTWETGRLFNIETDGVELTINAEGSEIKFGGYGLVKMQGSTSKTANIAVTINGGTFEGSMDNGALIKATQYVNATVVLNNVTYKDNTNLNNANAGEQVSYITAINSGKGAILNLEVNGGKYDADCGFMAVGDYGKFNGVEVTARGFCIYGRNVTVNDSKLTTKNIHQVSGKTPAASVAVSSKGVSTVKNSTLIAENAGPAVYVYNSGNDITLNGCTIVGTTITTPYMDENCYGKITIDGVVVINKTHN